MCRDVCFEDKQCECDLCIAESTILGRWDPVVLSGPESEMSDAEVRQILQHLDWLDDDDVRRLEMYHRDFAADVANVRFEISR